MESKSNPSSEGLPSYSESVRSSQQQLSPSYYPQSITTARTALISSLLTTYIIPHFYRSALSGLSSTTLILVPANVSSLNPSGKTESQNPSETIVGFPSAEHLTIVRLHGQENGLEFWRQSAVTQELGQQIRSHLRSSGYRVIKGSEASFQGPSPPPTADWRTVQNEALNNGEVSVQVATTEICLRTENDMGLYETRSGKAVVVKVNVGG